VSGHLGGRGRRWEGGERQGVGVHSVLQREGLLLRERSHVDEVGGRRVRRSRSGSGIGSGSRGKGGEGRGHRREGGRERSERSERQRRAGGEEVEGVTGGRGTAQDFGSGGELDLFGSGRRGEAFEGIEGTGRQVKETAVSVGTAGLDGVGERRRSKGLVKRRGVETKPREESGRKRAVRVHRMYDRVSI